MKDKFGYVESHKLMDMRLLICTVAVGFSLFALIWDFLRPFPESRPVLIMCVLSYPLYSNQHFIKKYSKKNLFISVIQKEVHVIEIKKMSFLSPPPKKKINIIQSPFVVMTWFSKMKTYLTWLIAPFPLYLLCMDTSYAQI